MSLMDKKISDLTAEDIQSLEKPVGIEGLPYPMLTNEIDGTGKVTQELGVIDSIADPMKVYTEMSLEKVTGKLLREMPIPSMLPMLAKLATKWAPASENRLFAVFGDPAFGKSYLIKSFGSIVHPKGVIQVDCGGMNMREIFFRTVIDYGAGVQEVLNKRLADGKVSQTSIAYMKDKLGEAFVEKDGRYAIDWNKIGAADPKVLEAVPVAEPEDKTEAAAKAAAAKNDKAMQEVREKYLNSAIETLRHVYEKEGISVQSNSFGIKTVPGEFFEAMSSGRPLFLDEFNKSKRGTLDSWQTVLQFLKGEEDSVTIYNPMSESSGDDKMKAITVTRADLMPGFGVAIAGNEGRDGETTQELSESMMTRLDVMYVGNPTLLDWESRISQIWTGMPLAVHHFLYNEWATTKTEEFTEYLLKIRKMGLGDEEVAAIPPREIYFLQHWPETVAAIKQVAALQYFRFQLSNPESALFEDDKFQALSDEISSTSRAKQIAVSFRKIITDHDEAIVGKPAVRLPGKGLRPNIDEAFDPAHISSQSAQKIGWHDFGKNMAQAMVDDIVNVTKDMPHTRAALITMCMEYGIIPNVLQEAEESKEVKPLAALMKYDELRDMGGTDELKAVQGIIMTTLHSMYPDMKVSSDVVVPLQTLGRIMKELNLEGLGTDAAAAAAPAEEQENKATGKKKTAKQKSSPKQVVVPNDDLNTVKTRPLVTAEAIASYSEDAGAAREEVDFRSVLAAMIVPDYAEKNREKIWLTDLTDMLEKTGQMPEDPASMESEMEIYNTLMGKSKNGFHLGVASAVNAKGEAAYLYILEDKLGKQTLVIGPEKISTQMEAALQKNGVTYLLKSDPVTGKKIDDFLTEGTRGRQTNGTIPKGTSNEVTISLINAFGRVSEFPQKHLKRNENNEVMIKEGTTLGSIIVDAESEPMVYTRFVKSKSPAL